MGTKKNTADLLVQLGQTIFPNDSNEIDAGLHAQLLEDLLTSIPNFITNATLLGLFTYETNKTYIVGQGVVNSNHLYVCTTQTTGTFKEADWKNISGIDSIVQVLPITVSTVNGIATIDINNATGSADGAMSSEDKTKLDNATNLPTVSTLVIRDAAGKCRIVAGTDNQDIVNLGQLKDAINSLEWLDSVKQDIQYIKTTTGAPTTTGATTGEFLLNIVDSKMYSAAGDVWSETAFNLVNRGFIFKEDGTGTGPDITPTHNSKCYYGDANGIINTTITPSKGSFVSVDDDVDNLWNFGGTSWASKSFENTIAGDGLTKTGNALNVIGGIGITANADDIEHTPHTGEVTGATALTIAANAVTNAKAAQMATKTYKGRTTAATGNAEDVPVATVKSDLALVKGDVGLGNVENTIHSTDAHTMAIDGRDVSADGTNQDAHIAGIGVNVHGDSYLLNTGDVGIGNYTLDSPTFHIDSTNHRVGVGTIIPTTKFEVKGKNGDVNIAKFLNYDWVSASVGSAIKLYMGTTSGDTSSNFQAFIQGGNNVGDIGFNPIGGKVGFGTKTPGGLLDLSPGTSGGLFTHGAEATVAITAVATVTIQVNVPAGAKILGVQMRVDAALAAGETWIAAYSGGATQNIATDQAVAANTKVNKFFDENAATAIASAEVDIAITKTGGGAFTAQGTLRAIVYYQGFSALANA